MKKILFGVLLFCLVVGCVYGVNDTQQLDNNDTVIVNNQIESLESGDSNISFENNYKGYCAEWGEHSASEGQVFNVESTSSLNNSNYLKTMFLFFYNQTQKDVYATQHMIWKFTDDKQFSRFNQTWYNQIISVGDSCTVPDEGKIFLNDTHQFSFDFKLFVPFEEDFQNFFAYQFQIEEIEYNSTVDVNNSIIENNTIDVNNSLINNSTISLPEFHNNSMDYSIDNEYFLNDNQYKEISIDDKETGANLWLVGCVIILLIVIFILNRRGV